MTETLNTVLTTIRRRRRPLADLISPSGMDFDTAVDTVPD